MNRAEHIAALRTAGDTPAGGERLQLPGWSDADWNKLLDCTRPRAFRTSEMVIQRGEADRALYFVVAGVLEVGITRVDGVSISPLAKIIAGSVIGEQSFFDGEPRSANVWADSDGELLRLEFDDFTRFSREHPALARDLLFALARVLSSRLRNTTFRVRR
ncbi:MAG: cyclic nucleotide-binding domain-containing protein [Betaproteobacteria bacterium]|nr:cyclic nucleotide-binding domain-containing protein [Betaproteobacteria bacterium]MBI2509393.1 cyclic nucleotide-binding domain-containing protein [Betaproteobacteria bacterium]